MISRRSAILGLGSLALVPVARDERPVLLVLTGAGDPRSRGITDAFKSRTSAATRISYELGPEADAAAFMADNTRDLKIDGVFAVGDRAFLAAIREFPTTFVVYTDVQDATAAMGRSNVAGIPNRADPGVALSRIRGMRPKLDQLGMVRSSRDLLSEWWDAIAAACKAAGVELVVQRVNGPSDLPNAFEVLLASCGAVWLQPDPFIWTASALARTLHDAQLAKVPVFGFDRSQLAAANPAPVIFESSMAGLGEAAAGRCLLMLGLNDAKSPAIWPTPTVVGAKAACRLSGILLNADSAAQVDVWVD